MGKKKADDAENIKVAVRVRPLNQFEKDRGDKEAVECDVADSTVRVRTDTGAPYQWTFDYVFNKTFSQNDIFLQVILPMIESVMDGFHSTIFAYGQSGSGKTWTMTGVLGDQVLEGIIPRSFHHVFEKIKNNSPGVSFRLFCSFLEIYNGKCRDLLSENQVTLAIREGADKNFFVQDLSVQEVRFEKELYNKMEDGLDRRCVGVTDLNAHSSRSHSLFSLWVERAETSEGGDVRVVTSKLNLVDLAGSERQSKTNASGDTLKEGANINLSLSALGTVIDSLVKGKGHIPFRSSPLTMLLKDSLGGNSKTCMFANIRPSDTDISETVSTLRFADRAKQIKNKPKIQMDPKDAKIAELTEQVASLKQRLSKYEGDGGGEDEDNEEEKLQERVGDLELEVEQATERAGRLETELKNVKSQLEVAAEESEKKVTELEEQLAAIQQDKSLQEQQLTDEKSQHHEVQALIVEFIKDMKSQDDKLNEEIGDVPEQVNYDVNAVAKMLDSIRERAQAGLGGMDKELVERELDQALSEQKTKFEKEQKDRDSRHKEEVERISALNEQAQTALNQAMSRLVKMKEKIEKEKTKAAETTENHTNQIQTMTDEFSTERDQLKAQVKELEQKLATQHDELMSLKQGSLKLTQSMRAMQTSGEGREMLQRASIVLGDPKGLRDGGEQQGDESDDDDEEEEEEEDDEPQHGGAERVQEPKPKTRNGEPARDGEEGQSDGGADGTGGEDGPTGGADAPVSEKKKKKKKSQPAPQPTSSSSADDFPNADDDVPPATTGGAETADNLSGSAIPASGRKKKKRDSTSQSVILENSDIADIQQQLETLRAEADAASLESQRLQNDLEQKGRETGRLEQELQDLKKESDRKDNQYDKERKEWGETKQDLEQELENSRAELMNEIQKCSDLNKQQVNLSRQMEQDKQHNEVSRRELEEKVSNLERVLEKERENFQNHQEILTQLKEKNTREVQRMEAKLAEKTSVLENNRKVLNTVQEMLEKKKSHQQELEDRILHLQQQIRQTETDWQQRARDQADKMTAHNNRRIEELMERHKNQLLREQKEKDQLNKKIMKEKTRVTKLKERYDQQMVVLRDYEGTIESLKENELKRVNGGVDEVEQQRQEIDKMLKGRDAGRELSSRQQQLLGLTSQVTTPNPHGGSHSGATTPNHMMATGAYNEFEPQGRENGYTGEHKKGKKKKNKGQPTRQQQLLNQAKDVEEEHFVGPPAGATNERQKDLLQGGWKNQDFGSGDPMYNGPRALLNAHNARAQRILGNTGASGDDPFSPAKKAF